MAKEQQTNKVNEEIGKWIMDIAKYLTTAVIVTTIIGNVENEGILIAVSSATVIVLMLLGVALIKSSTKQNSKKRK